MMGSLFMPTVVRENIRQQVNGSSETPKSLKPRLVWSPSKFGFTTLSVNYGSMCVYKGSTAFEFTRRKTLRRALETFLEYGGTGKEFYEFFERLQ